VVLLSYFSFFKAFLRLYFLGEVFLVGEREGDLLSFDWLPSLLAEWKESVDMKVLLKFSGELSILTFA